jgi:hypothetical protein
MDDKIKISIFHALIEGQTSNQIFREFHISNTDLKKVVQEYELIKQQLEQMKSLEEISNELGLSYEYLEKVRNILETDIGTNKVSEEMGTTQSQGEIPEQYQDPEQTPEDEGNPEIEEIEAEEDIEKPKSKSKSKSKTKSKTKGNSNSKSTKDLAQKMARSGEGETADVLLKDAGEIAKSLALERQEIGKLVQEYVGTIAAQYGYTNYQAFLEHLLNFWIDNQGRIKEMEEEIAQYVELVNKQNEILETDMVRVAIAKSLENVTYAALMGGATLDERFMDILEAYKHLLITDPTTIIKNKPQSQPQHQIQIQNNNISNIMTEPESEMNY